MRAIAVQWSPRQIAIRVYIDGEASQAVRENLDASVVTQVAADFPFPDRGDPEVTFDFVRCDAPAALLTWGHLVFARADTRFAAGETAG